LIIVEVTWKGPFMKKWNVPKEGSRLMMFYNGVLRNIFGPKRVKAIGDWRNFHSMELYGLYCSTNINQAINSTRLTGGVMLK
jgi:hypothetical protein